MAFNVTTQAPRLEAAFGSYCGIATGISTQDGATTVVTVPQLHSVWGVICQSMTGTNTAYASATSDNTFTITATTTEQIAWIAWGVPRL